MESDVVLTEVDRGGLDTLLSTSGGLKDLAQVCTADPGSMGISGRFIGHGLAKMQRTYGGMACIVGFIT